MLQYWHFSCSPKGTAFSTSTVIDIYRFLILFLLQSVKLKWKLVMPDQWKREMLSDFQTRKRAEKEVWICQNCMCCSKSELHAGQDCLHTQGGWEKLLLSVAGISHYCVCKQLQRDWVIRILTWHQRASWVNPKWRQMKANSSEGGDANAPHLRR